jgi:WhiB family transcriptional regulator, redox-sensing transcriptional regulator
MTTATRRPTTPATPTDWMQDGLCAQTDPALFFPDGTGNAITSQVKQAKKICAKCPVKAICLEWAVDTGQSAGVWGGLSEDERVPMRRERVANRSGVARCVQSQTFIEQRLEDDVPVRKIAEELGVSHTSVRRALDLFRSEQAVEVDAA